MPSAPSLPPLAVLLSIVLLGPGCSQRLAPPATSDAAADLPTSGPHAPAGGPVPWQPPPTAFEPPKLNFPRRGPRPSAVDLVPAFPSLWFDRPVFLTHAPDGSDRVFVLEQGGRILVLPNDPSVTQAKVFLDLTAHIGGAFGEDGLLGLAFDPDYANNGYFYVDYTRGWRLETTVSRFLVSTDDPDRADAGSETVLLTVPQPYDNHNGGMLAFGPDDLLYIALGDGGGGGDWLRNAQDLGTLLGAILRIDPHGSNAGAYGIPADNPFVGQPGARGEIWAYGLRNPWRFSFDRANGQLWASDVGQEEREEIDLIVRGGNYGWNVYEGDRPFDNPDNRPPTDFDQPIETYDHSVGTTVIGGYVYRGTAYPGLRGLYFYADNGRGQIWTLDNASGQTVRTEVGQLPFISSFGEDRDGELYVTTQAGEIRRIVARDAGGGGPFPTRLSETGLFADTANLIAVDGLIEYEVNAPLYSDDAVKRRWFAPSFLGGRVGYDDEKAWTPPRGAVLVKHFELPLDVDNPQLRRRLETRVLVHEDDGWFGYTYKWNAAQTDADLLSGSLDEDIVIRDASANGGTRVQTWTYPSRGACLTCHNAAAGFLLGLRTRQLNRLLPGVHANQIGFWNDLRLFDTDVSVTPSTPAYTDPADDSQPLEDRARSYLGVNCAVCHRPNGPGRGSMDLRHGIPRAAMNIEWVPASFGDLGVPGGLLVAPGSKEQSVLWERMRRLDGNRMPALGSNRVHAAGVDLLGAYLDSLR